MTVAGNGGSSYIMPLHLSAGTDENQAHTHNISRFKGLKSDPASPKY